MAATAVLSVVVSGHEDASTALLTQSVFRSSRDIVIIECRPTYLGLWAFPPKALNLAIAINLVILEDSELGLLPLVLDLLGGGVHLLLPLLSTTTEAEHEVKGRLLLDVVIGKSATVLELLAGEDKTLLVWGNSLLVCSWRPSANLVNLG